MSIHLSSQKQCRLMVAWLPGCSFFWRTYDYRLTGIGDPRRLGRDSQHRAVSAGINQKHRRLPWFGRHPFLAAVVDLEISKRELFMEANLHSMSNLFAQLGLPSDPPAIEDFIAAHRALDDSVALYRAPFWSASQKAFLKEEIIEDADWAGVIDDLNGRLR